MGGRISTKWTAAYRFVRNWFLDLKDRTGCRRAAKLESENDRTTLINKHCADQCCELFSLGRHGSPGPVNVSENVYRVLIAPVDIDMTTEQILVTAITHSETIGMSVLRENADDDEFRQIIVERTKAAGRTYHGVVQLNCRDVRTLVANPGDPRREGGDRHYIVVDTDMAGLPFHADIFNTLPRANDDPKSPSNKSVWRKERQRLLKLANQNIQKGDQFRGGALLG
jgi:hypothetical protein